MNSASKAIKRTQKILKKNPESNAEVVLIENLARGFSRLKVQVAPPDGKPPRSDWKIPSSDDFGSWQEYMRSADRDVAEVLVLHSILKFPVNHIAEALKVPEGTIYFRLGRGLQNFQRGRRG